MAQGVVKAPKLSILATALGTTDTNYDGSTAYYDEPSLQDMEDTRKDAAKGGDIVTAVFCNLTAELNAATDSEVLSAGIDGMHERINIAPESNEPGGKTIRACLKVGGEQAEQWAEAIAREDLSDPANFKDGKPALVRVHKSKVAKDAIVKDSLYVCVEKRCGRKKARHCAVGTPAPGEPKSQKRFAPTCLAATLFMTMAMCTQNAWALNQYDITGAYMLAPPRETFYLRQPCGWDAFLNYRHNGVMPYDPDEYLWQAQKNIYGMQEAGAVWYEMLSGFLIEVLGMQTHPVDACAFRLARGGEIAIVLAHVDDLMVMGTGILQKWIRTQIANRFPVTEGGNDYLGLQYERGPGWMRLHQYTYARKVAEKLGFAESNSVDSPLTTDWHIGHEEAPAGGTSRKSAAWTPRQYLQALGAIGYLATRTMPWLLYAYGVLATVATPTKNRPDLPTAGARAALARVLRWVNAHSNIGLTYTKADTFSLEGVVDANHAKELHSTTNTLCRSRSGGVIRALGATVHAFSTVQKATALSTFEAELYALVLLIRTILALRALAEFLLGHTLPPCNIYCDNQSTLDHFIRRTLTARSRHIRVHLGFIYDAIDAGIIILIHRRTAENEANTLTKAEDPKTFLRSLIKLAGLPHDFTLPLGKAKVRVVAH